MSNYKVHDIIQYVACVNAYTLSKEDHKVILREFNIHNMGHRQLLDILYSLRVFTDWTVYVECGLFDYLHLRRRKHQLKWVRRSRAENWPTTQEFIDHIEEANNCPGAFEEIYQNG